MNDNDLKSLLAKMLPETVYLYSNPSTKMQTLFWKELGSARAVLDTELLHLASLVEAGLTLIETGSYYKELNKLYGQGIHPAFATWQQRVAALASVKGVTL